MYTSCFVVKRNAISSNYRPRSKPSFFHFTQIQGTVVISYTTCGQHIFFVFFTIRSRSPRFNLAQALSKTEWRQFVLILGKLIINFLLLHTYIYVCVCALYFGPIRKKIIGTEKGLKLFGELLIEDKGQLCNKKLQMKKRWKYYYIANDSENK